MAVPTVDQLPEELRKAQAAIQLPEVQDMLRELAQYNLGIFMPHMHTETASFEVLPDDMVQVESDLRVSFVPYNDQGPEQAVQVAWRWIDDGVINGAVCASQCYPTTTQSGGETHRTVHGT